MLPVSSMKTTVVNAAQDEEYWLRAEQAEQILARNVSGITAARRPYRLRRSTVRDTMDCLKCVDLRQAFESKLRKYIEARSDAYYRVSTELAAHKNVDMERAWSDLEEHQLICVSAAKVRRRRAT